MQRTFLLVFLFSKLLLASPLDTVRDRVAHVTDAGGNAVVVFDIDDTLTDSRERTLRILRDIAAKPDFRAEFPLESTRLEKLRYREIQYELKDTLVRIGIPDPAFAERLSREWAERFFANEYPARDRALAGSAAFVRELAAAGARIVYLTGRDEPRMGVGTRKNLRLSRFPRGSLRMKPNQTMADLAFKQSEMAWIGAQGEVVAVFENEPANLNLMKESFPDSTAVFVDTTHSPKPVDPVEGAAWILDYLPVKQ